MNACRFIVYPCLSVINAPLYSLTHDYYSLYLTIWCLFVSGCKTWCATHKNSNWDAKCTWKDCSSCPKCEDTDAHEKSTSDPIIKTLTKSWLSPYIKHHGRGALVKQ